MVLEFVVVLHFDLDVAHAGDGDFFNTRMNTSRLDVFKRCEDERIVFRTCTTDERRFCAGVFRLWSICEHHQNLVAAKEERNKQDEQENQQAWETPHPVDCIIVIGA